MAGLNRTQVSRLTGSLDGFDPPGVFSGWVKDEDAPENGCSIGVSVVLDGRIIAEGSLTQSRPDVLSGAGHLAGFRLTAAEDVPDEAIAFDRVRLQARDHRGMTLDFGVWGPVKDAAFLRLMQGRIFRSPGLLPVFAPPENDQVALEKIALRFESLGSNCEFGFVQRKCGAEPLSLFRFAFISIPLLIKGLESRFQGIGDKHRLSFHLDHAGWEYLGRHDIYELNYHTTCLRDQVDLEDLRKKGAKRLDFLARKLIGDIEGGEKIFVIKSPGQSLNWQEVLSVFRPLHAYNPGINLLWMSAAAREQAHLAGRVTWLAPGLFHGFVDNFAPLEDPSQLSFEPWLQVCSSVAAFIDLLRESPERSPAD